MKRIDLTGHVIGRLTVVNLASSTKWNCVCECGTQKAIATTLLRTRKVVSCGCWKREKARERAKHHFRSHPAYVIWAKIKQRCYNEKTERFPQYGGRGILMCAEWKDDPKAFCEWALANGFERGKQIDRIDNNKGYSPCNCRFVSVKQNCRNRTTSRLLTCNGKTQCSAAWAEERGLKQATLYRRLKLGWSLEEALGFVERNRIPS